MFRKMRRSRQLLPQEESLKILQESTSGVLAVQGDDDYPYAVPLSFVYMDNKLYFHGAGRGHKMDAIARQPKVSFCVIAQDAVVPEEYTTYFRSVIAFGKARVVTEEAEMRRAIDALALKYAPDDAPENRQKAIDREWKALCMVCLDIEYLTGKEAIELVRKKEGKK